MKSYEECQQEAVSVRNSILDMLYDAGSGHPGGSLSCVEILVSIYNRMKLYPEWKENELPDHDRLVLSKGHGAPALYAVLAEHGFFLKSEFKRLRKLGGVLQGHPDRNKTPGVEVCTGSLGIGVSVACGLALANKVKGKENYVYVVVGDGELQEGIVWEALHAAVHYQLDHLIFIVDRNGLQIDGSTEEVMRLLDVGAKFKVFGFDVEEADGHDFASLNMALDSVCARTNGCPKCIVAHTVKGKGIAFMENQAGWHGRKISREDWDMAKQELEGGD